MLEKHVPAAQEQIEVRIAKDRMMAELRLDPEAATPPITMLRAALANRGVLYGILEDRLAEAAQQKGTWVVIAQGSAPKPPVHGRVEQLVSTDIKLHAKVSEDGSADLKELGILENVTAGMLLATVVDPVPGAAGRDVGGNLLVPEPAQAAQLKPGRHTTVTPDGRELVAAIDGRVVLERDGSLSVDNVFTVPGDVGPATGNINFLGSVVVLGNVCAEHRVRAAERVIIKGAVENAVVEAGHDITVHGGVFGGGKAVLQTPASIHLARAQECRLLAGGFIRVKDSLIRVDAVAGHTIHVERGAIIGGSATAPRINAAALGAESETRTLIEVGIAPRAKLNGERLQAAFVAARQQYIQARGRLTPLVAAHEAGKVLDNEDRAMMQRLESEVTELESRMLGLSAEVHNLLADPNSAVDGALVAARCRIGVVLASLNMERAVHAEAHKLVVRAQAGKLAGGKDGGGPQGAGQEAGGVESTGGEETAK